MPPQKPRRAELGPQMAARFSLSAFSAFIARNEPSVAPRPVARWYAGQLPASCFLRACWTGRPGSRNGLGSSPSPGRLCVQSGPATPAAAGGHGVPTPTRPPPGERAAGGRGQCNPLPASSLEDTRADDRLSDLQHAQGVTARMVESYDGRWVPATAAGHGPYRRVAIVRYPHPPACATP